MTVARVPPNWTYVKLEAIAETASGGTPHRKNRNFYGGSIPWVKSGELGDSIVTATEEAITEDGLNASSAKVFPRGTLCIALYGATVGKLGILDIDAATNQAICGIFLHPSISTPFVYYVLKERRRTLVAQSQGGAQPNISQGIVRSTEIPLPPVNEQRRIVDRIEALQQRTRRARQALDAIPPLIEKFRQSVLASAFRGDLTADWREQNPDVEPASVLLERINRGPTARDQPREWLTASFGSVMSNHDNRRVPLKRADRAKRSGKYPYYGASGVIDSIDDFLFDGDFLLIAEDGANLLVRRTPIAFRAQGKFWVNNHAHVLQSLPGLLLEFVEYYINSLNIRQYVSGSAQPKLTQANLNKIPIPIPPEEEQQEIVRIIRAAFARMKAVNDAVSTTTTGLGKLDQSILAKAFRGELVPQDPNDEPASVLLERIRAEREAQEPQRKRRRSPTPSRSSEASRPAEASAQVETFEEKDEPARKAKDFTSDDWHHALMQSIGDEVAEREDVIEAAAIWAAENMGLQFQRLRRDGLIVKGLKNALRRTIRRGEVEKIGTREVRRVL